MPSAPAPWGAARLCCLLVVRLAVIVQLVGLPLAPATFAAPAAPADPAAPAGHTPPHELISGFVDAYTIVGQTVYWLSEADDCIVRRHSTIISRTRTTGWERRRVMVRMPAVGEACPYRVYSNLVADSTYLYWVDQTGLVRFHVEASTTSAPETILSAFAGTPSELVMSDTHIYGYSDGHLWAMEKANPANNRSIGYIGPETARNLQWDGQYLYLIWGPSNALRRFALNGTPTLISNDVAAYVPIGPEVTCGNTPGSCVDHSYIYYVNQASPHQVKRWDLNGSPTPIYTAVPSVQGEAIRVYALAAATPVVPVPNRTKDVFFFEKRWIPSPGFDLPSRDWLVRLEWGAGTPDILYGNNNTRTTWQMTLLSTGDNFVWWREPWANDFTNHNLMRQATNAHALPEINLRVTDMHITQGVQRLQFGDPVLLLRDRHTYVRVMVRADGADVPNVSAVLTAYWGGVPQDHIPPVTNLITVRQNPTDTLQSNFLFALPIEWTHHNDLILKADLNPFRFPPEPNYADNTLSTGSHTFLPPPHQVFHILQVSYPWRTASGTTVITATNDFDAISSWLYRAFPLGLEPGQAVATQETVYYDSALRARVQDFTTYDECQYLRKITFIYPSTFNVKDDRNLCASYWLNDQLAAARDRGELPLDAYIYASVSGLPRGSEAGGPPVSNGPSRLAEGTAFHLAGYYAGHELGHLLGRGHPNAQSDNPATQAQEGCGHNPGDILFPYASAGIGDVNRPTEGFDSGINAGGGGQRLLRWYDAVADVMSYCLSENKWVSDYTYEGIYRWLIRNPSPQAADAAQAALGPDWPLSGDLLQVTGRLPADGQAGAFTSVLRLDSLAEAPALVPGAYALQLVAGNGDLLAVHAFTPEAPDSAGWQSFIEVVPFVDGTAEVQVVKEAMGAVVARQSVSPHAPVVTGVGFGGAAEPLAGNVSLAWTAADADGDALAFDVLYSGDGGATFDLLQASVAASNASLDTAQVPGGTLIFRVRASDGVNTGYADSAPVLVAGKAPQPAIMLPAGGTHAHYGQAIQLAGSALDAQDGTITSVAGLTWLAARAGQEPQVVGAGPTLSLRDLVPGTHVVRLTATNSLGLSVSTELELTVSDDLNDRPPALAVSPGEVGWQVENGETAPQTARVSILNTGGPGTFAWTASSDATWLTIDATSGSGEQALTLTAATNGLAANSTLTATVTITANHAGGQETTQVPVLLQLGAGEIWGPPAPLLLLYRVIIPFVSR